MKMPTGGASDFGFLAVVLRAQVAQKRLACALGSLWICEWADEVAAALVFK
jgi:hypothetical protein